MTNPALLPGNTPVTVSGAPDARLTAGTIGRGVQRLLAAQGFESLSEFPLGNGRRADVIGLGPTGTIWIVEIKSSTADFRADHKWPEYRDYCDALFFAVALDFPHAKSVALLLFIIAMLGFNAAIVIYNAYLPQISTEDRRDKLSSRGFALDEKNPTNAFGDHTSR